MHALKLGNKCDIFVNFTFNFNYIFTVLIFMEQKKIFLSTKEEIIFLQEPFTVEFNEAEMIFETQIYKLS